MENDELRELWKQGHRNLDEPKDENNLHGMLQDALRHSGRSLKRKLLFELSGMLVISALIVWMFLSPLHLPAFSVAMGAASLAFVLPNSVLFWVLIRRTRRMDYGVHMHAHLTAYIRFYRTAMRWYLGSAYAFNAVIVLLMIINPFEHMDSERALLFRLGFGGFMILAALIYRPYMHWMFGRHVDDLEKHLAALRGT